MASSNNRTQQRCLVFCALVLGLWFSLNSQPRVSTAQFRPAATAAQATATTSPAQARPLAQLTERHNNFELNKRLVAGEQSFAARYQVARQQACALPRQTLPWQPLGPSQVSARALCETLAEAKPFNPLDASGWAIEAGAVAVESPHWWAGAGINGLWHGSAAEWRNVLPGFVGAVLLPVVATESSPSPLYVVRQDWELLKSSNQGQSFTLISLSPAQRQMDDSLPVAPLAVTAQGADLWTGGRYLWRSTDGGGTWQRGSRLLANDIAARVSAIAAAPDNPNVVVAGTDQGELFRLDFARQADAQTIWPSVTPRAGFITSLSFAPRDSRIVYATYGTFGGAHIWQSTNGGATWQALDHLGAAEGAALPDVPVNALAIDPEDGQRLYAGSDIGVFATADGGAHWQLLAADFGAASVRALTIARTEKGKQLFVFTYGQGLWSAPLLAAACCDGPPSQQCVFSVTPAGSLFESSGGTGSINISAGPDCVWTIENPPTWIQFPNGTSGRAEGRVSFTVEPNPYNSPRNALLTVGGRNFWLAQQGANANCTPVPIGSGAILVGDLGQGDCLSSAYPGQLHYADRYTFAGRQGEFIAIGVSKSADQPGALGTLRLVTPTGEVIQDNSYPQNEVRLPGNPGGLRELPATGNYVLEVTSREPQQSFNYKVSLQITSVGCNRYDVLPLDRYFDPARATGRVAVSTAPACRWDAISTVPWLTFTPTNQGRGNALLEFTVASNTNGGTRSGSVEVAGQRFTVTQAGANGNCVPLPLEIGRTVNGAFTVNDCFNRLNDPFGYGVRPTDRYQFTGRARQRIQLTLNGVSRPLNYTSILLAKARGDLLANGSARLPNSEGFFELPSDGLYLVEIGAGLDTTPVPYSLSLLERNEGCSYGLTPLQREFEAAGGTGTFQLSTSTTCPWTVLPTPDWITIAPASSGQGSATLSVSIAPNTDTTVRQATLNIGGQTARVTQAGVQGRCAAEPVAPGRSISGQFTVGDCPPQLYPSVINFPPGCNCSATSLAADRYLFEATAGKQFSLLVNPANGVSGNVISYALADVQGRLLQTGTLTLGQTTPAFGLPGAGEYLLELLPLGVNYYPYNFTINLAAQGCETAGQISANRFDAAGGTGTLTITATEGCAWRVNTVEGAPWLALNGNPDGTGSATRTFTIAHNSSETLRTGTLQLGSQTFTILQAGTRGACLPIEITPGQLVSNELWAGDCPALYQDFTKQTATGWADRYVFQATAGQQVSLTGVSPGISYGGQKLTPVLTLVDPFGQVLSSSHANRFPDGSYLLPVTGAYTIEVSASLEQGGFAAQAGPYQMLVELTTPGCVYSVDTSTLRFANTATTRTLNVTTNTGCAWTPRATANWVTFNTTAGTGSGPLTFALARNETNLARRAAILIGGQSIEIEQAGNAGDCRTLPLSADTPVTGTLTIGDCPYRNGYDQVVDRYSFTAQTGEQVRFKVNFIRDGAVYGYPPLLYLYDAQGNAVTGQTFRGIAPDTYFRLTTPGTYTLEVVEKPNTFPYKLEMQRLAGTCEITAGETPQFFTGAANTGTITVRAGSGCPWAVRTNAPWLTLTSATQGTGNGTVIFEVAEYGGSVPREGVVFIEDRPVYIRQQYTPPNSACTPRPLAFGQTINGALTTSDCTPVYTGQGRVNYADVYTFEAHAGQKIALEAPLRQIESYLTLYNEQGRVLQQASTRLPQTPNEFITLTEPGRYFCELVSLSTSVTGTYSLKLATPSGCNALLSFANAAPGRPFDNQTFGSAGGTGTVNVTTGEGCPWTVQSSADWLQTSGSGTGPGAFTFTVQPNSSNTHRAARLGINQGGGEVGLVVEQLGAGGDCTVRTLTPGERVTGAFKTSDCRQSVPWPVPAWQFGILHRFQFTAQAGDQINLVQELPANYNLSPAAFTLYDPQGQTVGQVSQIHLPPSLYGGASMPTSLLTLPKSGVYTLHFVSGQPQEYAFRFGLTAGGCGFVLPVEQPQFTSAGGTGSLALQASGNCGWTATSFADWLTVNTLNGAGSGTIRFTVAPNPGNYRFTTLSIAGRSVTVFQTGADGSCAPVPLTPGQILSNELNLRDCRRVTNDIYNRSEVVDRFSITARTGEHVFVKATSDQVIAAAVLPMATLNAAQLVPTSDWLGNASYEIPADGTYVIEVFSSYNTQLPAPYTLRVQVLPPGCGVALSPASAAFESAGGTSRLSITTSASCQYQILSSHDWLTLNGPASRSGNQTMQFTVAPNTSELARTGTIGIGGQPFTVEQAGTSGQCKAQTITPGLALTGQLNHADCPARMPLQANYRDYADRYTFDGTAGQLLQLQGPTWQPSSEPATAQVRLFDPQGNEVAKNVYNGLRLPVNGDSLRLPVTGTYTIEIAGRLPYGSGPDASFDYTLLLTLLQPACKFSITPGKQAFAAPGGSGTLTIATATGCAWQAAADAPWVSVMTAAGTGNGQVSFSVAANPTESLRRATINLAGQSFTVEQAGRNGVCEMQPLSAGQTSSGKFDNGDCRSNATAPSGNQLVRRFSFSGTAGEQIALTLETSLSYPTLRLLSPLGLLLLSSPGPRLPQTNELYVLPTSGTYVVELYGYDNLAFTLTLFSLPNGCGYALNASGQRFEAAGGTGTINVTTSGNCAWQARSNAAWITVQGTGSGNGVVNYTVAPNPDFAARAGTIILANRVFVVEQAGQRGSCAVRSLQPGRTISGAWDNSDCGSRTHVSPYANFADRYTFNAVAGESLSVTLTTPAEPVFIELYDQQGSLLAAVQGKRLPANVGLFILPASGAYSLHVLSGGTSNYTLTATLNPPGTANGGSSIHVNAANFQAAVLAPDSLVTTFGNQLAAVTQSASLPVNTLGGTTVQVRDSAGATQVAQLLFVSPTQINYIMPGGLAYGAATLTIANSLGLETSETVQIAPVAPGLFTADASGRGLAAGIVLRVKADQSQVFEPLARFDATLNRFVAVPIELGAANEAVYLILFGTGYRWRSGMTAVTAQLNAVAGSESPVLLAVSYAGQQGNLSGLDQLNLALPNTLRGRGECEITLTVDGKAANPLRIMVK